MNDKYLKESIDVLNRDFGSPFLYILSMVDKLLSLIKFFKFIIVVSLLC